MFLTARYLWMRTVGAPKFSRPSLSSLIWWNMWIGLQSLVLYRIPRWTIIMHCTIVRLIFTSEGQIGVLFTTARCSGLNCHSKSDGFSRGKMQWLFLCTTIAFWMLSNSRLEWNKKTPNIFILIKVSFETRQRSIDNCISTCKRVLELPVWFNGKFLEGCQDMVEICHKQRMMQRDWDMSRFGGDCFLHGRKPLDAIEPCSVGWGTFQAWWGSSGAFY